MVDFYRVLAQHTAGGTARKRPLALERRHARMRLIRCFQLAKSATTVGPRIFLERSIDGRQGFNLLHRPRLSAICKKDKCENRVVAQTISPPPPGAGAVSLSTENFFLEKTKKSKQTPLRLFFSRDFFFSLVSRTIYTLSLLSLALPIVPFCQKS